MSVSHEITVNVNKFQGGKAWMVNAGAVDAPGVGIRALLGLLRRAMNHLGPEPCGYG